jgi:hypothetical protein
MWPLSLSLDPTVYIRWWLAALVVSQAHGNPECSVVEQQHQALHDFIEQLQHPQDCRAAPLYVYIPTAYTSGLGSQVRMIAHSMLQAMSLGRTFIVDAATSGYTHPGRCPSRSYDCLFKRLSTCTLDDALVDLPVHTEPAAATDAEDMSLPQKRSRVSELTRSPVHASIGPRVISSRTSCFKLDNDALRELRNSIRHSSAVASRDLDGDATGTGPSRELLLQHVVGYVGRPTGRVEELARQLSQQLALNSTAAAFPIEASAPIPPTHQGAVEYYLGVHVRRGDKGVEAVVHESHAYVKPALKAAELHGLDSIFLASDDPLSSIQLPQQLPDWLRVAWVPHERFLLMHAHRHRQPIVAAKVVDNTYGSKQVDIRMPTANVLRNGDEGEMLVAQLLLLSRAHVLIGTLTSNYLLLAFEMAVRWRGLRGEQPPSIIDVDGNEYFMCSVKETPPWGPSHGRGASARRAP